MLFNSSREFSYPQFSLSAISLSEFGKSHFGSLRSTRTPFSCKTIPRPPMVNGSTLFSIGDFPYREIGGCGVVRLLQHKTPTARHLSSTRSGGPTQLRHLSARVIGDRGIAISPVANSLHYKTPNPDSPMPRVNISRGGLRLDTCLPLVLSGFRGSGVRTS
jgi:hypothetical protein